MENSLKFLLNYFVSFIEITFAEGYIFLLLIGLLILLIGLFFIVVTLMPIMFGAPSIKGVVAGAIKPDIKRTSIDQEVTTKKGMLFPVFNIPKKMEYKLLFKAQVGALMCINIKQDSMLI